MALDLVRPLKLEDPAGGGTELNLYPTELDPHSDAPVVPAVFLQQPGGTSVDRLVNVDRSGNALRLTDTVTSHVLGELVSSTTGQNGSHNALLDVIHFLEDGPGDGWASGAYCAQQYTGIVLTGRTWYTSAAQTAKIVSFSWTYQGVLVSSQTMTIYNAASQAVRTVVDTYTYNGVLLTGTTRTWS